MTQRLPKPKALTDLPTILPATFDLLQRGLKVPKEFSFALEGVDEVSGEQLSDPVEVAAFAMRKIQLLNYIARPGVVTAADIVIGLCREIVRAVNQLAPWLGSEANEEVRLAYDHLVGCATVVATMLPGGGVAELV